jgi:hypothetical protein
MSATDTERRDLYEIYTEISLNAAMQDQTLRFHFSKATAQSH